MKSFCIYHKTIPKVGGIESAIYHLAKGLDRKGYKVIIAYGGYQSINSLFKYAEVADVVDVTEEKVKVDICLQASNHQLHKNIEAKRYFQWVHSDYEKCNTKLENKDVIDKYIAVTKWAKKVIEKQEGIKGVKVILNILDEDFGKDKRPILKLLTVSRVSGEKGFDRMLYLAKALKERGVRFVWWVYGDNAFRRDYFEKIKQDFNDIEEVYFIGYKSDTTPLLEEADYVVQLSDFEGCPYSILEALKMEVPCIVTNWGGADEIIEDGKNGYILPMKVDTYGEYVDKIVNNIPKFKYKPLSNIEQWIKIIEE